MNISKTHTRAAILAAATVATGAAITIGANANTLIVPQGEYLPVTASAAYDAVEVHGALSMTGTSGSGTVLSLNSGGTMTVGSESGDSATVTVGNYAQLNTSAGTTTIGGNGGTGLITLGGTRIGGATDILTDNTHNTASLYSGNIWASEDATGGTIDLVRLNEGGLLLQPQRGCKIVNPNTSCDARILFNGGVMAVDNAWGAGFQFQSVSGDGGLIESGKGGKAIVLESEDNHTIDLRYRWGNEGTTPVLGTVRTAGNGSLRVWGETGSANHYGWSLQSGKIEWGHKGDFELANNFCLTCAAVNVLPCLADGGEVKLTGNSQYNWLNLKGSSQSVNGLIAMGRSVLTNSSATEASLIFGSARADGTFSAPVIGGNINVRKVGAGTLTITNTAAFSRLSVEDGTARICRNATGTNEIGTIELSAGTTLVVDGTIVRAAVKNAGATVSLLNGGQLVSTTTNDSTLIATAEDVGGNGCAWEKSGTGTLAVVATNLITIPSLHVAEGTLRLSACGSAHPWLRFSFTAMYANANFCLSEIKVMDGSGNRVDGGGLQTRLATTDPFYNANVPEGSDVANASSDTTPVNMTPQSVWASDATFSLNNTPGYRERSPSCLFDGQTWTKLQYSSKATAANPKVFVLRLPSGAANAAGYLFRNGYSGSNQPSAWTLESSPDGVNWTTVDSKSGVVPPSSNGTWYNGGEAWPINSGDVPGAAGFAPTAAVQVDEGAALDCSLVTGGQTLSNIVVDWALGGGTIRNAVFAANGTLSVVNAPDANLVGGTEIPLDFDGVSGTENLRDWTLVVNGVSSSKRIRFSHGRIAVGDPPTVMVFR